MPFSDEHLAQLSEAKRLLENPGLAVKITNLVGKPIGRVHSGEARMADNFPALRKLEG